jgi:hypothetical protein
MSHMTIDRKAAREWYTLQQAAAEVLLIAEGTLSRYVNLGIAPRSIKIGNGRRFSHDWLSDWILEGGVTRPDRAAILRTANHAVAARRRSTMTATMIKSETPQHLTTSERRLP